MFLKLLQTTLSAIQPKTATPDYEAFQKSRHTHSQGKSVQRHKLSQAKQKKEVAEQPINEKIKLAFYDFLLGQCDDNDQQDPLTDFIVDKISELLKQPELFIKEMPTMPKSVSILITEIDDPDFNVQRLITVIEKEPAVATALIRLANSSMYKRSDKPITDLRKAFVQLGAAGVKEGVLNTFIKQMAPTNNLYFKMFGQKIWLHAEQTAQYSRQLAELTLEDEEINNAAYFTGLLHHLGKMIIFQLMIDAFKVIDPSTPPNSATLKRLMQEKGDNLTIAIAQHWQLPNEIVSALPNTNRLYISSDSLVSCVHQASIISEVLCVLQKDVSLLKDGLFYAKEHLLCDEAEQILASQLESESLV
ncbi:HDOD domain-containing protein [Catenovulum sediminis]|uniref:HDOD domain-containing protein n=1 Tax=Catenovulum sediminis TaxID=1740262 RepID=A0ABV1RDU2_9ALTE